jgi:hypothetical protein
MCSPSGYDRLRRHGPLAASSGHTPTPSSDVRPVPHTPHEPLPSCTSSNVSAGVESSMADSRDHIEVRATPSVKRHYCTAGGFGLSREAGGRTELRAANYMFEAMGGNRVPTTCWIEPAGTSHLAWESK